MWKFWLEDDEWENDSERIHNGLCWDWDWRLISFLIGGTNNGTIEEWEGNKGGEYMPILQKIR